MKIKSIFLVVIILIPLVLLGCGEKDNKDLAHIQEFADPMTEQILISLNQGNYQGFAKNLSDKMKNELTEEMFDTQMVPLKDVIGTYQEGAKEILTAEGVDKNFIQVIYNTKYTQEQENVIVTVVFNTDENNRKIEGFFMNSPKLQKM